jgi:DNA-binding LacI/PurR family transcriptional regulator
LSLTNAGQSPPTPGLPTLAQVAELAGVSPATASRVLNHSARVSATAQEQVRQAVARLGYVRRRAARADARRRAPAIAGVVFEPAHRMFADPFLARVLASASEALGSHEVPLLLAPLGERPIALERFLCSGNVDGVLVMCPRGRDQLAPMLSAASVPVMMIGRPLQPTSLSYVDADNRGGARRAVEHLVSHGRKVIATVAGPPDRSVGVDRREGWRDGLNATGTPLGPIAYGDFSRVAAIHATGRLLATRPELDAIFAASDLMALGVLHALRRAGRRVPDDVAVVGFDDLPLSAHTDPPLTTVRQPVEEMGAMAALKLLALISEPMGSPVPEGNQVLPTSLVIRRSG